MPVSKEQARAIGKAFLDLSHELGSYRFAQWQNLKPTQRRQIEDAEWDLLNHSNNLVTQAVGLALDDMVEDLKTITDATGKAKRAVGTIRSVKDIINVAAAVVVLGAAIASGNPQAVATAAKDALKAVQEAAKKDEK